MKKLLILCSGILSVGFANVCNADDSSNPIFFTTIEQAQKYCPDLNSLIFTPNNAGVPNSAGKITADKINPDYGINMNFTNFNSNNQPYVPQPMSYNPISNIAFRLASVPGQTPYYGYMTETSMINVSITCLYSYQTFTNNNFYLIEKGSLSHY